jgi:hypothetical protein
VVVQLQIHKSSRALPLLPAWMPGSAGATSRHLIPAHSTTL